MVSDSTTSYSTYPTEWDAVKVVDVESLKNIVFFVNCEKNPILVGLQPWAMSIGVENIIPMEPTKITGKIC